MRRCLIILCLLSSCGKVCVETEYTDMQSQAHCRTGHCFTWDRSCESHTAIHSQTLQALRTDLSEEQAVKLALSNNPELQAQIEELGLAKAALVQAGLLTNPSLSIDWRLPSGKSSVESSLLFAATDLWQLPIRKQLAARKQAAAHSHLLAHILRTAAMAKYAYYERQHAQAKLEVMEQLTDDVRAIKERVAYRKEFGFTTDLDIAMADSLYGHQLNMLLTAERMNKMSNLELRKAIGLTDRYPAVAIMTPFSPPTYTPPSPDQLIARALRCNPEIQALERELWRAEAGIRLAKSRVIRDLGLGIAQEKSPGEANGFGPSLAIQIPIFDQNQAQIARAQFLYRQKCKLLAAKKIAISTLLRETLTLYATTQKQLKIYREQIIPALERAIDYTTTYSSRYQINRVIELQSLRSLTAARAQELDFILEAKRALATLEELVGERLQPCS